MKTLLSSSMMLCIAISFFACKKDNDSTNAKTKTQFLTQASWRQTNSENGTGGVFTSDWADYDACEKDDITTFKTDKTFQTVEGATKCDPGDPDINNSGPWNFSSGETELILNSLAFTIVTLDDNNLILTISFGGSDTYRATFSH